MRSLYAAACGTIAAFSSLLSFKPPADAEIGAETTLRRQSPAAFVLTAAGLLPFLTPGMAGPWSGGSLSDG
ncbi:hypothetical protein [Comamonas sp. w2-DMI]|uniref:hypothetical protein n=1 Tax=Comamonas sp. w2-DMI TaxID=3126391 RepID=UPI0032E3F6A4